MKGRVNGRCEAKRYRDARAKKTAPPPPSPRQGGGDRRSQLPHHRHRSADVDTCSITISLITVISAKVSEHFRRCERLLLPRADGRQFRRRRYAATALSFALMISDWVGGWWMGGVSRLIDAIMLMLLLLPLSVLLSYCFFYC